MRTKLLVASESDSSITTRITPEEIGELLAKCNPQQFKSAMDSLTGYVEKYGTEEQQGQLLDGLIIASGDYLKYWEGKSLGASEACRKERLIDFGDLASGARFTYQGGNKVWIKLDDTGCGKVAEYSSDYISHEHWVGQSICSAKDSEDEKLIVVFHS